MTIDHSPLETPTPPSLNYATGFGIRSPASWLHRVLVFEKSAVACGLFLPALFLQKFDEAAQSGLALGVLQAEFFPEALEPIP